MFKIFINFKTYPEATGEKAVGLAKICAKVNRFYQKGVEIIPVVQVVDLFRVSKVFEGKVWVQHLDWQEQGRATGWVIPEAVAGAGAQGTLLNHSEHHLPPGTIKQIVSRIRALDRSFSAMVCAGTLGQLKRLIFTKPDYLAYEIKDLIAGSVSITKARPKSIYRAVSRVKEKKIPLIVGAGINQPGDVFLARKMGAGGVLISSAVVLADNPEEKLRELAKGASG